MNDKVSWLNHVSLHQHGANWSSATGICIFLNPQNPWVPLYIGQAASFKDHLPSHEQWNPARKLEATHVHAKAVSQESQRDTIEKQLI